MAQPIMVTVSDSFVDDLHAEVGDFLRVVATHSQRDYVFQHIREDVIEGYTAAEFERIFDDLVLEGMQREHFESLFHVGSLNCVVLGFDEAVIFYFTADELSGVVVSTDRDAELNFGAFLDTCKTGILTGG